MRTSHKKSGRLTPRLHKRAVSGRKLDRDTLKGITGEAEKNGI